MKEYEIIAKPISVNELYGYNKQRKYLTKEGRKYKDEIIAQIGYVDYIFDKDVHLEFEFYITGDKDVDNLLKASVDALTEANIFYDDKQVVKVTGIKHRFSDSNKMIIRVYGNCVEVKNTKSILFIFGKIIDVKEYLKEKKDEGYKVVTSRGEVFMNGNKYTCVSKRQYNKLDNKEVYDEEIYR